MNELLTLINKDIRQEIDKPILSKFNFLFKTSEDDLDEGVETEHWYADKEKGIEIRCDKLFLINVIFLHSGRKTGEDFLPYCDELAGNLSFEDSKRKVLNVLGEPSVSKEPFHSRFSGDYGGFDRYDFAAWSIHFEYSFGDGRIDLITIMSPDTIP